MNSDDNYQELQLMPKELENWIKNAPEMQTTENYDTKSIGAIDELFTSLE